MAICDELPGLTIKVKVGDEDATEYDDSDGPQEDKNEANALNRVFKYIESKDGANFSIHASIDDTMALETNDHALCVDFFVDGKFISGKYLRNKRRDYDCMGVKSQEGRNRKWKLWPLQFSSITTVATTEKARVDNDLKAAKSVGLIQVHKRDHRAGPTELAEKSVKGKAVSHGLSFGTSVETKAATRRHISTRLDDGVPFVVYDFKYHSLRKLMVIPRTPSPDPVEEEIGNLSQEAIVSLARRQLRQERAASMTPLKAENKTAIKKEVAEVYDLTGDTPQGGRKRKRVETIDLTDC
ncbi:hypothetical protein F5X68DRAFT_255545 [Plectosphaerella plurivora]|uniref:DUF7918 domain-containing protein n=1 Tax=Plectosphaerella plurivora TaxID=936078 RepID=A0A9P8VEP8_9PEZI|nr:hypothetical protein F5X68DRAFT_255545 [Plectosphaerella plurivora]